MMRQVLYFLAGLVFAILFAGAAVVAIGFSVLLIEDAIESQGSGQTFEARIRHRTDSYEIVDDGPLREHRSAHPYLETFGFLAGAWILTIVFARATWLVVKRRSSGTPSAFPLAK
jgi:hypothetical protein